MDEQGEKKAKEIVELILAKNVIRNPPGGSDGKESAAMQESQVGSLGREDLLEKGMDIHSSILGWKIPWTEEPGGLQPMG